MSNIPAWAARVHELAERARVIGRDESLSREERERAYQAADSLLAVNGRYQERRYMAEVLLDLIDQGYTRLESSLTLSNVEGDLVRLHRRVEGDFIRAWLYLVGKSDTPAP